MLFLRGLFGLFSSDLLFQGVEKLHNSKTGRNTQTISMKLLTLFSIFSKQTPLYFIIIYQYFCAIIFAWLQNLTPIEEVSKDKKKTIQRFQKVMRQNGSKHWKWTRWVHLKSVRKYKNEIADPGQKLVSKYRAWKICWKRGKCSISNDSLFGVKVRWFPFLFNTVHPKHFLSLLHSIVCLSFSIRSITVSCVSSWVTIFLAVFHTTVQSHQDICVRFPLCYDRHTIIS